MMMNRGGIPRPAFQHEIILMLIRELVFYILFILLVVDAALLFLHHYQVL